MDNLTNQELFDQLKKYGFSAGPVNESTRFLYENRLKKLIRESDLCRMDWKNNEDAKNIQSFIHKKRKIEDNDELK